jgi:hypothetical protein
VSEANSAQSERDRLLAIAREKDAQGDWSGAREAIAEAIDTSPPDALLHAHMGWYTSRAPGLAAHERERLVSHHLGAALEINPREPWAHFYQGRWLVDQGNGALARRSFAAALEADPSFVRARDELARLDAGQAVAAAPAPIQPQPRRAPRSRAPILAALAVLSGAALAAERFTSGRRPDLRDLETRLGTTFHLDDASQGGSELLLEVGSAWDSRTPEQRESELSAIARSMSALHVDHVRVLRGGAIVGEVREGKVCASDTCLSAAGPRSGS